MADKPHGGRWFRVVNPTLKTYGREVKLIRENKYTFRPSRPGLELLLVDIGKNAIWMRRENLSEITGDN